MNLKKVFFLGGDHFRPAVKVRCVDIATRLGCAIKTGVKYAAEVPEQYYVYVCVKPTLLEPGELHKLAKRGKVVWDVVDYFPPKADVEVYLTSTTLARDVYSYYGKVAMIPHHHCNFEGTPNPLGTRQPVWIGSSEWFPRLRGFEFPTYFSNHMSREEVVSIYRQMGIGLNLRGTSNLLLNPPTAYGLSNASASKLRGTRKKMHDAHLVLSSGIKLINCMGFGIPSISSDEPAYHDFGADCTIFTNIKNCAKWVRALQHDDDLYMDLRKKCLRKAGRFHIDAIIGKYKKLLHSL